MVHHLVEGCSIQQPVLLDEPDLHFAQPMPGGGWVVAKCRASREERVPNLWWLDENGQAVRSRYIGDAVNDLQVSPDGMIWISFFDEHDTEDPDCSQIIKRDSLGECVLRYRDLSNSEFASPWILDCYQLNVVSEDLVLAEVYPDKVLISIQGERLASRWEGLPIRNDPFAFNGSTFMILRSHPPVARLIGLDGQVQQELEVQGFTDESRILDGMRGRGDRLLCRSRSGDLLVLKIPG